MKPAIMLCNLATICVQLPDATAQTCQWVRSMGSMAGDFQTSAIIDPYGDIYLTGTFAQPYGVFGNDTLNCLSVYDIFLTKMDGQGDFLWAKRAGGIQTLIGGVNNSLYNSGSISYDSFSNSLFLASTMAGYGHSYDTCSLHPSYSGTTPITRLTNLDLNGNCNWTAEENVRAGTVSDGNGHLYDAINVGVSNPVYINGQYIGLGGHIIKRRATDGSVVWHSRIIGESSQMAPLRGCHYRNGMLYLTGTNGISPLIIIGSDTLPSNPHDLFISMMDTALSVQWTQIIGGPGIENGGQSAIDGYGNLYIIGSSGDSTVVGDILLENSGTDARFLAKYDGSGVFQWVRQANSDSMISFRSISSDGNGNACVSGYFSGTAIFGDYDMASTSSTDLFIAKFDTGGNCKMLKTIQTGADRFLPLVRLSHDSSFYLISTFTGTLTIDGLSVTSQGGDDVFIAKFDMTSHAAARLADNQLHIYANPTTGRCNITIPDEFVNKPGLVLRITDMAGNLVIEQTVSAHDGRIRLNLEAEATGVYNVNLTNGRRHYTGRVVFQ